MIMAATGPLKIFISYAHKDDEFLSGICTALRPLELNRQITVWTDRLIVPGRDWHESILQNLADAHLILLLVSPDFLASEYITHNEIKGTLNRSAASDDVYVIQVLVRPIVLNLMPFGQLQAVPTGARPVSQWPMRDEAWNDVLAHVQKVIAGFGNENNSQPDRAPRPPRKADFTDTIVKLLFVLLIAVSIGVFFYGMIGHDPGQDKWFYSLTSLAGMGSGCFGYAWVRKWA
jgi:hypothetical protein